VRILVLGAGVIGSVYAGKLLEAGHEVVLLARGSRLADLQSHGLLLEDAESGNRMAQLVASVSEPAPDDYRSRRQTSLGRADQAVTPSHTTSVETRSARPCLTESGDDAMAVR